MGVAAFRDLTPGFERDVIVATADFLDFRDLSSPRRQARQDRQARRRPGLASPRMAACSSSGPTGRRPARRYPAGALIATHLEAFLSGDRDFDVLFEPAERKSLAGFSATRHHILITELDNVRSRVYVLTHRDGRWHREPLPGVPEFGEVSASDVDADESDDYFLTVTDFLTPTTLALGTVGGGPATTLKQLPEFFDARGLAVTQHEAISQDGTRVPYFEVGRKDLVRDGNNPTLLYGYGGFEISMLPSYRPAVGAAWLEKGGVYVVANIRGGGEFGPEWHQSALKANRHKAYEDFIAVAEDLIRRKVTSPAHLGTQGGSNGGLLMGNMLVRRPDLFGAIVCQVPLLDMKRYHHLLAGASWMGEYGNPDLPEEWAFIRGFSPYHNVEKSAKYPRTLLHDLDPRRPRPSRPRAKDGGQDEGPGSRRRLLREHRRGPRRRRRQQAGGVHAGSGLYVLVE